MQKNSTRKMSKFAARLMPSLTSPAAAVALTGAALILYFVPWLDGGSASLTFGAYDLAEWTSLHPAVRFGDPALLMTLLLRLVPALLVIALAARVAPRRWSGIWWLTGLAVLLTAGGLLPPFEFIANRGDPNYAQQFMVALVALVGGLFALSGLLGRFRPLIAVAALAAVVASAAFGLAQAYALMDGFGIPVTISVGGPGLIICALALAVLTLAAPSTKP
jgi:hypothetical protein